MQCLLNQPNQSINQCSKPTQLMNQSINREYGNHFIPWFQGTRDGHSSLRSSGSSSTFPQAPRECGSLISTAQAASSSPGPIYYPTKPHSLSESCAPSSTCRTSSFRGTFATAFRGCQEAGACRGGSDNLGDTGDGCRLRKPLLRCRSADPGLQRVVARGVCGTGNGSRGFNRVGECYRSTSSSSSSSDRAMGSSGGKGRVLRGCSQVNPWVQAAPPGPGPGAYDVVRLKDGSPAAGVTPGAAPSYTWGKAEKMVRWVGHRVGVDHLCGVC
jgi:hypothetical protein